ncbi:RNA polymerase sigma-70 factor [Puteibacter caeruleilacunae]|nr:RNA polymerase sigma-70 factor [Puteibacter caeruleilacunae]
MSKGKTNINSEKDLVQQLRRGDEQAFEKLFHEYSFRLYRFALGYLHEESDAEEVVQDVFLKVWNTRTEIKSDSSFKSYVFTIAYNEIRRAFNKRNIEEAYKQGVAAQLILDSGKDSGEINYFDMMEHVDRLIENLPAKRREILILNKKEGLDTHEIAEYLNVAEKTVRNLLSLAMSDLKSAAKDKGLGELLFFSMFYK